MQPFRRLAVLGLGLLGGSVALAAHRRGVAALVAGGARRADVRALALARGAVDMAGDFETAAAGADLVVVATDAAERRENTRSGAATATAPAVNRRRREGR